MATFQISNILCILICSFPFKFHTVACSMHTVGTYVTYHSERIVGQNVQKSMLACILPNTDVPDVVGHTRTSFCQVIQYDVMGNRTHPLSGKLSLEVYHLCSEEKVSQQILNMTTFNSFIMGLNCMIIIIHTANKNEFFSCVAAGRESSFLTNCYCRFY